MQFSLEQSVEVLRRTPNVLRAQLGGLNDVWARGNYGDDTFSPFDVVGHLIHAEQTNWMPRLRIILEHGPAVPFPPFDRYAMYETSKGKSVNELLDTFASLRATSLADLSALNLTPGHLDRPGVHPQLGGVTLRQLIASWVVHDLGHTHQIAKAMSYQYRHHVGPWREYLSILPKP